MLKIYLETRKKYSKKFRLIDYFNFNKIMNEIFIFKSSIIVYFALKFKISANMIDVLSVLFVFMGLIMTFLESNLLFFLGVFIAFFSHAWDYADGDVARRTNSSSAFGHMFDETAGTFIIDLIYIAFSIHLITTDINVLNIVISFIIISLRTFRVRNFFSRIFLSKASRIRRKTCDVYILLATNEFRSKSEKNTMLKLLYKIFYHFHNYDYYYILVSVSLMRFQIIDLRIVLSLVLIIILLAKLFVDLKWSLQSHLFEEFEFELIKKSHKP